jgi:enoyl-CoA hydratase
MSGRAASALDLNEPAIGFTVPRFAIELARHRLTPAGFARVQGGDLFGPDEAMRLGYVDRVVEPDALEAAAADEAARLARLDPTAFRGTKARVNARAIAAIRAALAEELAETQAV